MKLQFYTVCVIITCNLMLTEGTDQNQPDGKPACEDENGSGKVVAAADGAAAVVGGTAGAAVALPWILGSLGFTQTGVVAGSIAAGIQATMGNIAAGSLFAWCQSAAVVGVGGAAAPVALAASGAYGAYRYRDSLSSIPDHIVKAGESLSSYLRGEEKDHD